MSYFLFIDESGHDRKHAPYEVLAGIAIHARDLWNFIQALHDAEGRHFAGRYSQGDNELKGRKILKSKVFHHANLNVPIPKDQQAAWARKALDDGPNATVKELKALALAKLDYVSELLEICARYRCRAFASIVETDAEETASDGLRKDYSYLFERFYYFLEDQPGDDMGVIVFDELEKTQSHILVDQAHRYFRETAIGRIRAGRVVPEPFFVHSELTTGVQVADLIAYIVSWGFRTPAMSKPRREELSGFAETIAGLRHMAVREKGGNPNFCIWSFAHITDMRTRQERGQ